MTGHWHAPEGIEVRAHGSRVPRAYEVGRLASSSDRTRRTSVLYCTVAALAAECVLDMLVEVAVQFGALASVKVSTRAFLGQT